jgi:hypothetical protein
MLLLTSDAKDRVAMSEFNWDRNPKVRVLGEGKPIVLFIIVAQTLDSGCLATVNAVPNVFQPFQGLMPIPGAPEISARSMLQSKKRASGKTCPDSDGLATYHWASGPPNERELDEAL